MKKVSFIRALGIVCAAAVMATGCGSSEDAKAGAQDAAFQPIRDSAAALDAKRQEIANLEVQIAEADAAAGEEAGEGEAAGPSVEELQAQLSQAETDATTMSEDFMNELVMFLNSADMVEGEAPAGVVLEAIRLKSGEDLLIAKEYIVKGGDYRRALDILDTALVLDPDNPDLQAAKAQAEADQFMTEERFAQVQRGMTPEQVQALLGTVNRHNVRDYPERNVTAWFYRREDKGAAGVYFQEKGGEQTVYKVDFDAVESEEEAPSG